MRATYEWIGSWPGKYCRSSFWAVDGSSPATAATSDLSAGVYSLWPSRVVTSLRIGSNPGSMWCGWIAKASAGLSRQRTWTVRASSRSMPRVRWKLLSEDSLLGQDGERLGMEG